MKMRRLIYIEREIWVEEGEDSVKTTPGFDIEEMREGGSDAHGKVTPGSSHI